VLAKPENAFAGDTVPVKTTAATAIVVDVSKGNAPISTAVIAETNIAKRCQAGAVRPAGTGDNAIANASAKGKSRLTNKRPLTISVGPLAGISRGTTARGLVAGLIIIAAPQDWNLPATNLRVRCP